MWPQFRRFLKARTVIPYKAPVKAGSEFLASELVLDWPRYWREPDPSRKSFSGEPEGVLQKLDTDKRYHMYYEHATDFVAYSKANENWFEKIRRRTPKAEETI
jgi:hypothetical protein